MLRRIRLLFSNRLFCSTIILALNLLLIVITASTTLTPYTSTACAFIILLILYAHDIHDWWVNLFQRSDNKQRKGNVELICNAEHATFLMKNKHFLPVLESIAQKTKEVCLINYSPSQNTSITDLETICKNLNIVISRSKINGNNIDGFCFSKNSLRIIVLRKGLSKEREAFTLAHELGHLILGHKRLTKETAEGSFARYRQYLRNEFEANHFAGAVLVERNRILKDIETNGGFDTVELAKNYAVPYEVILNRIVLLDNRFHFVKLLAHDRTIRKKFSYESKINWLTIEKPCRAMAAVRAHDELKNRPETCKVGDESISKLPYIQRSQLADLHLLPKKEQDDAQFFCSTRLITQHGKIYSLTIGTRYKDAGLLREYRTHESVINAKSPVSVSAHHCADSDACPARARKKHLCLRSDPNAFVQNRDSYCSFWLTAPV